MAEIYLENVTRIYHKGRPANASRLPGEEESAPNSLGTIAALDHVTLRIPHGKTCVVVGPSGCGKSTLLRVVAGLDLEYTGEVYYDNRNVRDTPPRDRYIGMVFQNYALYPHFHGVNNLRFFFWMHKAPDAEAEERIRATAEIMGFGFNQLLIRKPGALSGGQQQRLAIARALVRQPQLFLLDEPLSNLDAKLRTQTRVEIKRLLNRFQITAIYVTHDQEEAVALGDLIAIMRGGRVEQMGSHAELRANPANAFVAGFLGSHPMNLVNGVITDAGTLRLGDLDLPLPPTVRARCQLGQTLILGVRPEMLGLAWDVVRPPGGPHLNGEVETIEADYARRLQYVRVRTSAGLFTMTDTTNEPLAITQGVAVLLPADSCYFFDAATGRRIQS